MKIKIIISTILFSITVFSADRAEFDCQLKEERNFELIKNQVSKLKLITQNNKLLVKGTQKNQFVCEQMGSSLNQNPSFECENWSSIIKIGSRLNIYFNNDMTKDKDGILTMTLYQSANTELPVALFFRFQCNLTNAYYNLKTGSVFEDLKFNN